jgi:hypothetical protein
VLCPSAPSRAGPEYGSKSISGTTAGSCMRVIGRIRDHVRSGRTSHLVEGRTRPLGGRQCCVVRRRPRLGDLGPCWGPIFRRCGGPGRCDQRDNGRRGGSHGLRRQCRRNRLLHRISWHCCWRLSRSSRSHGGRARRHGHQPRTQIPPTRKPAKLVRQAPGTIPGPFFVARSGEHPPRDSCRFLRRCSRRSAIDQEEAVRSLSLGGAIPLALTKPTSSVRPRALRPDSTRW